MTSPAFFDATMFIYEYMAGLVDQITGDEDDFDPHVHRKIEKPTTYSETMIHLLKGSIGAGILAMPDAVQRLGLIGSPIGVAVIGIFATYCIHLLIAAQYELCKRHKKGYMSYPKSMRVAVQSGPKCLRWTSHCWPYFVDSVLVLWQLGLCCVYAVFVAENIKQVLDVHNMVLPLRTHIVYLLPPLLVVGFVKQLKMLTPLSSISNVVTLLGLILVFYYLIEDDFVVSSDMYQMKSAIEIPVFVGITLFALEAVGVILALEYNMDNPKRFGGICGLFNVGMFVILIMYMLVGVFGFLKYKRTLKASITLNLPPKEKKAQAAKIILALAIFLSFPLQNFVAYTICWRRMRKRLGEGNHRFYDYLLRIVLIVVPWLLAVALPKLGPFIALFGALCLSLLAIIFPGIMDLCLWYPNRYGRCLYKWFRDFCIIILGSVCLVSGVYTSILEIKDSWKLSIEMDSEDYVDDL